MGLGYQFAAAGWLIYTKAKAQGLGRELPTEWFTEDLQP
jgi:alanine dehydrogenase